MVTNASTLVRRIAARTGGLPSGTSPQGTPGGILAAAVRLFAEQGFAGTSIRDIAREAGVRSATLYAHYSSKEHVLAALVEIGHREHHQRVRKALLESDPDPRRQLTAFVRAHVRMHTDFPMLCVVANAELHELSEKLGAVSLEVRRQSVQLLVDVIERGIELGAFRPPHPWLAAAAIGGMGLRVAEWFTPEFELGADEVAEAYAQFALGIVGAGDGACRLSDGSRRGQ